MTSSFTLSSTHKVHGFKTASILGQCNNLIMSIYRGLIILIHRMHSQVKIVMTLPLTLQTPLLVAESVGWGER